ncbi:MAG: aminomethyl-transferring glycine dehydrogenase subunit GcvPA [Trueperaceae bacterium]|nr:aminomethyl-transferring glycine dehydrogenase subunit GcvPA [Trueperaceae bacterium]
MPYVPHTDDDVRRALAAIGVDRVDDLFADVPAEILDPPLDLPAPMDEVTLLAHLDALAARDQQAVPTFLGGGVRRHFIPAVTPRLALQGEFVTAYTPYQAEVSQGVLQSTFEFQTMMSELTGLPNSNASMYDGASAVAEAALLAVRQTHRETVMVSRAVHPETREVLQTYLWPLDIDVEVVDLEPSLTTPVPGVGDHVAALIVQDPNHLGYLEDMPAMAAAAHAAGALLIAVVDPLALAVLREPGSYGADIAVGDGQVLGVPMQFGGPAFGFMVVTDALLRQLPGRLVGQTTDVDGRRAFVLTLQAREQHIRRSKAKSNICSNHQLAALLATVNMAALGPTGLREMAEATVRRAHRLAAALRGAGADVAPNERFFAEFVLRTRAEGATVRRRLAKRGVRAGVPVPPEYGIGNAVTLAATELTTDADIEALLAALHDVGELGVVGTEVVA